MTAAMDHERPVTSGSPRLAALALLIAGGAAVGLAVHPGSALASTGDWTATAVGQQTTSLTFRAATDIDDPADADDPQPGQSDGAPDDGGLPSDSADDDSNADDDSGADDGGAADDDTVESSDDAPADETGNGGKHGNTGTSKTSVALVIDRRSRARRGPRTFAISRTARAAGLRWTGWSTPTATAKGRVTVRHGRARAARGAGSVTVTRLATCSAGRSVYRRATLTIGGRTVATVALPGCSKLR